MSECIVVGKAEITRGTEEAIVIWLETNPSDEPRFVYIVETDDILTESQFLDLAS